MKYFYSILIALLIAVLILFLAYPELRMSSNESNPARQIIRDTIVKIVQRQPITLTKVKTKIIRTSDTIIRFSPFKARVDTVLKLDTIRAEFEYPSGLLLLDIRRRPDTLLTEKVIIYETKKSTKPWWEQPAIILGSAAAGYLLGTIGNK